MGDNSTLRDYINAVGESSKRSRLVISILVTASVLSFAGFLNSRIGSWTNERVRVAKIALAWYQLSDDARRSYDLEPQQDVPDQPLLANKFQIRFTGENIKLAQSFIQTKEILNENHLKMIVDEYEKMKIDNVVLVRVPFFGIQFDVNDLGIVSGSSFIVILIMLRFCLKREMRNVRTTFAEVRNGVELRYCYTHLSMMQVLTVPPILDGRNHEQFWMNLPKKLVLLPVGVHALVFGNDLVTLRFGFALSFWNTYTTSILSAAALGVMVMLAFKCVTLLKGIDTEWEKQYEILTSNEH